MARKWTSIFLPQSFCLQKPVQDANARPESEVEATHEPSAPPPGFGLRQSSGAFGKHHDAKAAEDCRSPKRWRDFRGP
jgi:hypothetical protein